ncbi:hypothetical protein [Nesterenkonia sp. K-15-9-6]|uniref:hypothetical protein n=1 Tax=Nesterenkonia sp. K-15-9-6 TaxID=3093918 RepID=UPI004044972D
MFLISSFQPVPNSTFQGYCWQGSDLIIGQDGAHEYSQDDHGHVGFDSDGCYILARKSVDGWTVGTDSRGLARLFFYEAGDIWALSSSLTELVAHLRRNRVILSARPELLRPFGERGAFTSQLTSSETYFSGIRLLPSFTRITLTDRGPKLHQTPASAAESYEAHLSEYLSVWRARAMTLLRDPKISIAADLSGGLDSRTVLALLLSTGEFSTEQARFRLASSPDKTEDLRAASTIAEHYGLELNGPRIPGQSVTDEAGTLEHWKTNSMGVYLPLYLNNRKSAPSQFQAHGAGGGNFRPHFKDSSISDRIKRYKRRLSAEDYTGWLETARADMRNLSKHRPHTPPMILHYREFRNRFHFGHNPHRRAMFTPLNSAMTDSLTDGPQGVNARQLYFDIMESLAPGLKDLPYDRADKAPTQQERESVTRAELTDAAPGRIFGDSTHGDLLASRLRLETSNAYETWLSEAERAVSSPEVRDFMGHEVASRCDSALIEATQAKRPLGSHHRGVLDLSYALTIEFAFGGQPPR